MSSPGDDLLTVVSVRRRLPWNAFRKAFDQIDTLARSRGLGIEAEDVGLVRWRSLRLLSDLAHVETPSRRNLTAAAAAPTAFARLPQSGLPRALLTGARDSAAAARYLRTVCKSFGQDAAVFAMLQGDCGGYAPSLVMIEAIDESLLSRLASLTEIPLLQVPPAWRLLHSCADLEGFWSTLSWETSREELNWPRRDFDRLAHAFRTERQDGPVRLTRYTHAVTTNQLHFLVCDGKTAVDTERPDWPRWWFLHETGCNIVFYDPDAQTLGAPVSVPLPALLARALMLFSGSASVRRPHPTEPKRQIDVYKCIPKEAAELAASKLGQKLITHQISGG